MKSVLKYLLEFVLVLILGFVAVSTLSSVREPDITNLIFWLFVFLGVVCVFGIIAIVYRWIKVLIKK